MTSERLPFACIPRWIVADPRFTHRDVRVLAALTAWADLPDGARPSQQAVAKAAGMTRQTAQRGLEALADLGVVDVEARWDEAGGRLPNRYSIRPEFVYADPDPPPTHGHPPAHEWAPPPVTSGHPPTSCAGRNENKDRETNAHPPAPTASAADAADSPRAEETLVYDDRSGDVRPVGEVADELCGLLADWIESHGAAPPFDRSGRPPRRWRDAVRLMLTKDGRNGEPLDEPLPQGSAARSPRRVASAIEWAQRDDFWCANVLSPVKLRQQYDRLRLQARRRAAQPGTAEHQAAQQSRREQQAAALRAQGR